MDDAAQRQDEFADLFESAFARLRIRVETACASQSGWPLGAAAAIRAALEFAASDPNAIRALTTDSLAAGKVGFARYDRLISYLCDLLLPGRAERPEAEDLPSETERALAGGVAMLVAQRIDLDRHAELPALAAEAIQFVLTPYLGIKEARRIAAANLNRGWDEARRRR
jgi:hypothetical protein